LCCTISCPSGITGGVEDLEGEAWEPGVENDENSRKGEERSLEGEKVGGWGSCELTALFDKLGEGAGLFGENK
jgi:hypothetical protein